MIKSFNWIPRNEFEFEFRSLSGSVPDSELLFYLQISFSVFCGVGTLRRLHFYSKNLLVSVSFNRLKLDCFAMSLTDQHHRHCLLCEFHLGKTAAEVSSWKYSNALPKHTCEPFVCFFKFQSGNEGSKMNPI